MKSISGWPAKAWLAVDIPGVWILAEEDPENVSTMSLTSNASISDNIDICDINPGCSNAYQNEEFQMSIDTQSS